MGSSDNGARRLICSLSSRLLRERLEGGGYYGNSSAETRGSALKGSLSLGFNFMHTLFRCVLLNSFI